MPIEIPYGEVLTDSSKREWLVQTSIGRGGFGEIYTACLKTKKNGGNYVIKIEPIENEQLFYEKNVYLRIGKKEDIKEYIKSKNLKALGMPTFLGAGTHTVYGKKYRFLVLERYGKDLWTIFLKANRQFPPATVFKIAIQVLDVLEYIHSTGYVHADIKGPNLLLGRAKGFENQIYLVDFGLATRYKNTSKPNQKRIHNGTLEYISRDGHEGIVTRRGDIEVLGYNLLQWLSSNLPWEGETDLAGVQAQKNKWMSDVDGLMEACFEEKNVPEAIEKYFEYLTSMQALDEPNYDLLRQMMKDGITLTGDLSDKLKFNFRRSALKKKSSSVTLESPVPTKVSKISDKTRPKSAETCKTLSSEGSEILDSNSEP